MQVQRGAPVHPQPCPGFTRGSTQPREPSGARPAGLCPCWRAGGVRCSDLVRLLKERYRTPRGATRPHPPGFWWASGLWVTHALWACSLHLPQGWLGRAG